MIEYEANNLTTKQHYKFLTGSIIPRPIAWVTTFNKAKEVINAAPFSYFSVIAKDLPLVSLSINRQPNQQMKDTAKNLSETNEAVIQIVNDDVLELMNATAATLSETESELSNLPVTMIDSKKIAVPGIQEAPIRLEVKVHQYIPITNNQTIISDLFILEILHYSFSEDVFDADKEYILPEKLSPVARLAGETYSHISNLIDIKRPK